MQWKSKSKLPNWESVQLSKDWIPLTGKKSKGLEVNVLGQVRSFKSGAIRDNDSTKPDYIETVSWSAFRRFGNYMTGKKQKYGSGNFKKGIPVESYEQSLVRHLQKYLENKYEQGTDEVNEDHLCAMIFNINGILHEEERIKKNEKRTS